MESQRIILFAIIIFISRIAFDWFILPQRVIKYEHFKNDAIKVAKITGSEPVQFYKTLVTQYGASYYISLEAWKIVGMTYKRAMKNRFYIVDGDILEELRGMYPGLRIYHTFPNIQDQRILHLIKIKKPE
jgi:hypothetical protein